MQRITFGNTNDRCSFVVCLLQPFVSLLNGVEVNVNIWWLIKCYVFGVNFCLRNCSYYLPYWNYDELQRIEKQFKQDWKISRSKPCLAHLWPLGAPHFVTSGHPPPPSPRPPGSQKMFIEKYQFPVTFFNLDFRIMIGLIRSILIHSFD